MDCSRSNAVARRMGSEGIGRRSLARALGGGAVAGLVAVPGVGRGATARQGEAEANRDHPAMLALAAVLDDAAGELTVPVAEIAVQSLEARDWPDGCLGLGGSGEACTDAITPGYRIVLGPPAAGFVYRTDQQGAFQREPALAAKQSLRVHFELSGGFAGLQEELEVDTADLSTAEAGELRRLIGEADFWSLPEEIDNDDYIDDGFEYTVTVSEGLRRHSVSTYDGVGGAEEQYPGFWALLGWLQDRIFEE